MTKKYHFNTKTGNPNVCRATRNCPFGGPEVHYNSPEDARKGYEARQDGSFSKPLEKPAQEATSLWSEVEDFADAPVNTVVEFADGTRFIKTDPITWETSSNGGISLENQEMAGYPERKGIAPGSKLVKDDEPAPAAAAQAKGTVKVSLLKQAAYEDGLQARRYFLLLNHRNPEQLAAAVGSVKDQELVADVQALNRVLARQGEIQKSLKAAQDAAATSKTDAQREGYERVVAAKLNQLQQLAPQVTSANAAVEGHMKKYAKQLVIHRRSLDALERLANEGVKASPPGLKDRVSKLEKLKKETPSVAPIKEKLNSGKPDSVLQAAREFGNPIYIRQAESYASAARELDGLNNEAASLQRAHNSVTSQKVKDTAAEELLQLQRRQRQVLDKFQRAQAELKLFQDDIKARFDQEKDVERELSALSRLGQF